MKFAEINSIWTADLDLLSNADKGRVYYERAKQIVEESRRDGTIELVGEKVSRTWLAARVGCGSAALSQNPRIKALLQDEDKKDALIKKSAAHEPKSHLLVADEVRIKQLEERVQQLEKRNLVQLEEISSLRSQVQRAAWIESEVHNQGIIPW
jgi:hypothetical protein